MVLAVMIARRFVWMSMSSLVGRAFRVLLIALRVFWIVANWFFGVVLGGVD